MTPIEIILSLIILVLITEIIKEKRTKKTSSKQIIQQNTQHHGITTTKTETTVQASAQKLQALPAAQNQFEITEEHIKIKSLIEEECPIIFIHGGAGTGKSFLIQWLRCQGLIHIFLAPTGLAALNINGMTIHKFLRLPPIDLFPKNRIYPVPKDHLALLHNARTICIDEISMVRSDLLDQIERSLRSVGNPNKIFGGYQMVFVGDLYQLPPVLNDKKQKISIFFRNRTNLRSDQQWDSPWFPDAECLKNQPIQRVDLTKVFRQTDQTFVKTLNKIRKYQELPQCLEYINSHINIQNKTDRKAVLVFDNNTASQINSKKIAVLKNKITYHAAKTGVFLAKNINNHVPVPDQQILGEKAFVMIVCNDPNGRFVNGSTGIILALTESYADVMMKDRTVVRITPYTWKSYHVIWDKSLNKFINEQDGSYTQIPLIPAYAITCHKAQGKTLESVYLAFDTQAFAPGQAYVALSRVHDISGISASRTLTLADFPQDLRLAELQKQGVI